MRELRALFEEAKKEAAKDEPDGVKLKALLGRCQRDGQDLAIRRPGDGPMWQGVQRVARMFGLLCGAFEKPVQIFVVDGGNATPVTSRPTSSTSPTSG